LCRKIDNKEIEISNYPTGIQLTDQAKEFNILWEEFELKKMDVTAGSKWYLLSSKWLINFKEYVLQFSDDADTDAEMKIEHPGMILNEDILDEPVNLLKDPTEPYLDYNLKENLREEENYFIVNQEVWNFLYVNYGGIEICRFGMKRADSESCLIEVNLIKLNIHYFPTQQDEDESMYTIYESRHTSLNELRGRIARLKNKKKSNIRLWKAPIPKDFEQFYRNNLCEWRKHRHIRLNAELLK